MKRYDHGSSCLAPIFLVSFLDNDIPGAVVGVITIRTMIIDINSNGVIYDGTNGNLMYASWEGKTWNIQTVESAADVGQYNSLVLDSSDRPHIS